MITFDGSDINLWLDWGISPSTRTIYLGSATYLQSEESGIEFLTAARFIKQLFVMNNSDTSPIDVLLNSPGGDEYYGVAIYEAIRLSKAPVHIKVIGHAMSMAAIILQAGARRIITKNSVIMLHYGTFDLHSDSKDVKSNAKENERFNRWMEEVFLSKIREKKPKYTLIQVRKLLETDNYITATQALKLGLVDEIV